MRPMSRTKLSDDDVMKILDDQRPVKTICADYGVGRELIGHIKRGLARRPVYEQWKAKRTEPAE